ncbi:MAG: FtsX-like permease family protein [Bacteroidota bacterium]|nr:FtsX-like permease family protein [Bacteroidota bacterium]
MRLSLYIAKRYLFAKKSRNAINVISGISAAGVTIGTMVLIIVLSVFNGLEDMVHSLFSTFDPDLEVRISKGKVFVPTADQLKTLDEMEGIADYSLVLQENALLHYDEQQYIATVKGVNENYPEITGLDSVMWDGSFMLREENGRPHAVVGLGVANNLSIGLNFITPLIIYVPERKGTVSSPADAFVRKVIFPSGIFSVEQEYDSQYIYVPIEVMRELLMYNNEVSSIEIKFTEGTKADDVQPAVEQLFGPGYAVRNKYQQQEIFYKVMKSERLAIFFILTFILIIASFNIIGSLTMLIIEKERDIGILRNLGANNKLIKRIFIFEGWMISILGAVTGLLLGFIICWLQKEFGMVKLQGETLIMDAYPVTMKLTDFLAVLGTVLVIGYIAAWYPAHYMSKKYLRKKNENKK